MNENGSGPDPVADRIELAALIDTGQARKLRRGARVSAGMMARLAGVGIATLNRWERGKATPNDIHAALWLAELRKIQAARVSSGG